MMTTEEWHIRAERMITDCIGQGRCITYADLAEAACIPAPHRIHQLTIWLEDLMERDHGLGQPLRAAVVVSRTSGIPARGFFEKLDALGPEDDADPATRHQRLLVQLIPG